MVQLAVNGISPRFGKDCFFAVNSTIVGDVEMGDECSVWFNAVIRGDVHYIRLGHRVNVQDGAVIHCTYQKFPTEIGNEVSIGHNAIVHGCTIHDKVLVGMGAIIMDGCVVESNSIIAAGAVLTQHTHVPSGTIFAGVPFILYSIYFIKASKSMCLQPVVSHSDFHDHGDFKSGNGVFHFFCDDFLYLFEFWFVHIKDKFVMNLQDHF